jgi:hypothetical protein
MTTANASYMILGIFPQNFGGYFQDGSYISYPYTTALYYEVPCLEQEQAGNAFNQMFPGGPILINSNANVFVTLTATASWNITSMPIENLVWFWYDFGNNVQLTTEYNQYPFPPMTITQPCSVTIIGNPSAPPLVQPIIMTMDQYNLWMESGNTALPTYPTYPLASLQGTDQCLGGTIIIQEVSGFDVS